MKPAIISSLAALLAATVTAQDRPSSFTVMALRSASPIHFLPMQAAGRHFWLGGKPSTYCPVQVGDNCPPGNHTVISGLTSLSVLVPGGQRMYVEPSGALGFTQAHSIYIPPGSIQYGFEYTPGTEFGIYGFTGFGATGWMACPVPDRPSYQVFAAMRNATVPSGDVDDCLGFSAAAIEYKGPSPAAWQYA
ncbi:hypothetical protein AJ80_07488 [Polytolypa hystricis UAMH7299]|uniref:IgE-binding protein n=1 Tax=Polytolypa hystricis (strain UAMH7299) TaxID=1447883 RepID=A0A2B7XPH3_POLH7|nr:hypothetical protein AJ80_07488 [Polytolypa hystricis UAMH7299]